MDVTIQKAKKTKHRRIKAFERADIIPYFISLLMLIGIVYFIYLFKGLFLENSY
jgi:hypothetical protein